MSPEQEQWALFWCHMLHPVIFAEVQGREVNGFLKGLAETVCVFPNGKHKKPSLSTLKRKLKRYRQGGFDGLVRRPRKDRDKARAASSDVIATAVQAKKEQPRRSDEAINRILQDRHGVTIKRATLYRYLKLAGATRIKLGVTKKPVRKRWTREHTHDLWLGDFQMGPRVLVGGQTQPSHLSAFIDCHSRYVVDARYYLRENLDILIDTLLRAWATHGAPRELYVDNAKVYHSHGLRTACARLHIRLRHRPPRDPAPGGLIERFFETVQSQFEPEIRAGATITLDQLNRAFSAWLHVSYHRRANSDTGQGPSERYQQGFVVLRSVDMQQALASFMERVPRKVDPDFADIRLQSRYYRVDPRLRGDKVEVRYDPFSDIDTVEVYSLSEEYLGQGLLHERQTGAEPTPPAEASPLTFNYTELLIRQHDEQLAAATQGVDYALVTPRRPWPFPAFGKALAHLLGRKGGLAAFTPDELDALRHIHNRSPTVNEALLKQAVAQAQEKSIPHIGRELHRLAQQQERP